MKACNLCRFPILRLAPGVFGTRCLGCGSTLLHRAIGLVVANLPLSDEAEVYEMSSAGALVRHLRRRFARLTVSEYFDDVPPGQYRGGIQCQDVQRLTYPGRSFDLVTSTEVFEHVPDDRRGFLEVHRVLRAGGHFVFTVPLFDHDHTVERAHLDGGVVRHLLQPEYHHDRLRGRGAVLAFRNYGRDIRQRLEDAGFLVDIRTIDDARHAINAARVLVCRKPPEIAFGRGRLADAAGTRPWPTSGLGPPEGAVPPC